MIPTDDFDINVFIDGGWGVNALIGYKTRGHNDIDIFVEKMIIIVLYSWLKTMVFMR